MVPVMLDGATVRLEMRLFRPDLPGRVPTLVFNHGSTGFGNDPALFAQPINYPALARFFAQRGWAVVIPARRGRAGSEGLYDEGFSSDRKQGYSCEAALSMPGADRALRDIAAAMDSILAMSFVDRDRVAIGGHSRGGILSVAYAGAHPDQVRAVINFVGGWIGAACGDATVVNAALFRRGASYADETLWIYGDSDPFYPLSHSRGNFRVFELAGGKGSFQSYARPGVSGHSIVSFPDSWGSVMDAYLERRMRP